MLVSGFAHTLPMGEMTVAALLCSSVEEMAMSGNYISSCASWCSSAGEVGGSPSLNGGWVEVGLAVGVR